MVGSILGVVVVDLKVLGVCLVVVVVVGVDVAAVEASLEADILSRAGMLVVV